MTFNISELVHTVYAYLTVGAAVATIVIVLVMYHKATHVFGRK